MKKKFLKSNKAFTLIELLVVVAIIGILASVIIASLNSARDKGKVAFVKSNLKNMIAETELYYSDNGSYSTATNGGLDEFITVINNNGGTAKYYSYDGTRWGVSAKLNSDTTKRYSVDSQGIVTWDSTDVTGGSKTWEAANTACASIGGRLPSLEELKSFWNMYGAMPPGFSDGNYWSSSILVSSLSNAYGVNSYTGNIFNSDKGETDYVRCVR